MSETEHKFGSVALMGPPNAGKSTFLNHLLGQKVAIVSPKPQTTRVSISGIWTEDDAQVLFLDTPGVHTQKGRMNRYLLQSAWQALSGADAAVLLLDAARYAMKPGLFERETQPLAAPLNKPGQKLLIAANKVDLVKEKPRLLGVLARIAERWPDAEIFPISAKTGDGVGQLAARIKELLPEGPPAYPDDQLSTLPLRFMAAEIVREKLFISLSQELPYSTAVEIEQWEEEPEKNLTRINAVIYVGRSSHKAMVIGKGGSHLKEIGRQAREEIEELIEGRVYLELWVKVREDWTEDPGFLREMGLGE